MEDEALNWVDRGGLVDLRDDGECVVGTIPLDRLQEFVPFLIAPWSEAEGLAMRDVQVAIDGMKFCECSYQASEADWTLEMHAQRIAWLVKNPSMDPIEVEFPYPDEPWMELRDGWHRLAAAQFSGASAIAVSISGFIDHAAIALGARLQDNPAPTP